MVSVAKEKSKRQYGKLFLQLFRIIYREFKIVF